MTQTPTELMLIEIERLKRRCEALERVETSTSIGRVSLRPQLFAGKVSTGVPTFVYYGVHGGYSMPIWNSGGNANEELYFREYVPGRWDGVSNPTGTLKVALASAETAGEDFRFQISWSNNAGSGVLASTSLADVETQQELASGRAAQYDVYVLSFTFDYTAPTPDLAASDLFGGRLRRVAATGAGVDEVDGEVIILDFVMTWQTNKTFKV